MKLYLSLFILRFKNSIQYRIAALAGISTQIFFGFIFISVYLAFYQSNPNTSLPMEWQELVNYLWLNQALFALVYTWTKDNDFLSMIKNGNIAYEFARPNNFYKKWFATMYGNRIASVSLRFLPVLIMAFILPYPYRLGLPSDIKTFIIFLFSIILSSLIVNSFTMLYHLITIYTLDEKGILSLFMVIGEIFAGGTVPLAFFPSSLQFIANILPFKYICDLPFRIYSGSVPLNEIIPNLIGGIIWLIILLIVGNIISKKATKKAIVQGG